MVLPAGFSPVCLIAATPSEVTAIGGEPWTCPSCGKTGNKGLLCSKCGTRKPGLIPTVTSKGAALSKDSILSKVVSQVKAAAQSKTTTQSKPAGQPKATIKTKTVIPPTKRKFQYVNVIKTDGKVSKIGLSDSPDISFSSSQLTVGSSTFNLDKVQRLEYGGKPVAVKTSADYSTEKQKALFVFRNDGQFNAFEQQWIERIDHSAADTVRVVTADSLYQIPIAAIDSITLHAFETVYNQHVVTLGRYEPYVQSVSVEQQSITFSKNLPDAMKPKVGDILYCDAIDATFPDGFAGRVVKTDGYACSTERVSVDEVYERVLLFGSYVPEDGGKSLALADDVSRSKGPSFSPDDDDNLIDMASSVGFNMGPYEYTIEKGPVSATLSSQFSPAFSAAIMKKSVRDNAFVHIGIDVDYQLGIEATASGEKEYSTDPSFPLIKPIPIPDFPIVSVGLDLQTFAGATLSGKVTAGVTYFGGAHVAFDYCAGEMSLSKRLENGSTLVKSKAEAKGELYLGLGLLPNVQLTGWMLKAGPTFYGGPKFVLTLPLNSENKINCFYDALKEATLDLFAKATFTAKVEYKLVGKDPESKSLEGISPEIFVKRWYFVPLFTEPALADPLLRNNVTVSSTASRDLLLPVEIGYEIQKGGKTFKEYVEPESYEGPKEKPFSHQFSGFEYDVEYTALPTVGLFGHHMEATPVTTFVLHPEVRTEDPVNVTINSATIVGRFPDVNNKFQNYGIKYAPDGGQWIDFKTPRQDKDGFFRVNLNDLKENTLYKVQAYLVEGGKTYLGEEKTFLTRDAEVEFKNPGNYHFEWQYSTFMNDDSKEGFIDRKGYYERKGHILTTYDHEPATRESYYTRVDGQAGVEIFSVDGKEWYDEVGSSPNSEVAHWWYDDFCLHQKQRLEEARIIGHHAYNDPLGYMAFFCEEWCRRMKQSGYSDEKLSEYLTDHFIGTDTVAGVLCNVYCVSDRFCIIWVDPVTSLTLRYEYDDHYFEVTSFSIDGFDINNL